MDLKQLNTFLMISKLQSFTRAADTLNYAQSSVTTQIKLLEEELGVKLFERIGKNISLTHDGKKLIPYAQQMLKLSTDIKNNISEDEYPKGVLTIGVAESLCVIRLPEIIKEYRKLYPEVEIALKFGSCADFRRYLNDNLIDVAFSLGAKIDGSEFISEIERDEPMLLLAYPGNHLLEKEKILPEDLEGESLILTEVGCSYRAAFERILKDEGISPRITLESGSVHAIKQFTMSGLGISLLPRVAVEEEVKSGKLIPLKWQGAEFEIVSQVLYHKNKWISPTLDAFINLCKEML
ncbi:LysR family transcriptional regulator [Cellulosilyticum sp. WCF-2]|uniref:LysR family transcriptional regulator n=1 Tax=Cellulosilyticum sp. WCF-2 TaxID=2497860 RepID=UPI000F8DF6C2|nr:LysR family transcriptional regulator [Cellulosilyticum sp. WCF-2]QEH68012.1 LysR family transcriptional regulator [Cellulosilyticum sp. WCF-2]